MEALGLERMHSSNKCTAQSNTFQADIDKTFLYVKDLFQPKYQYLIKVGQKHFIEPKTFIEYLNDVKDVIKIIEE